MLEEEVTLGEDEVRLNRNNTFEGISDERTAYDDEFQIDLNQEAFLIPWLERNMNGRQLFDLVM